VIWCLFPSRLILEATGRGTMSSPSGNLTFPSSIVLIFPLESRSVVLFTCSTVF
jgi:hypothetical protein